MDRIRSDKVPLSSGAFDINITTRLYPTNTLVNNYRLNQHTVVYNRCIGTTPCSSVRKAKIGVEGSELYLFQYLAGAQRALKSCPVVGGFSPGVRNRVKLLTNWLPCRTISSRTYLR